MKRTWKRAGGFLWVGTAILIVVGAAAYHVTQERKVGVRTPSEKDLEEQPLDDERWHLEWGYAMGREGGATLPEAEVMLLDDSLDTGVRFQVLLGLAEREDSHARDVIKRAARVLEDRRSQTAPGREGGAALLEAEVMLLDDSLDSGVRFHVLLSLAVREDSHARNVIKKAARVLEDRRSQTARPDANSQRAPIPPTRGSRPSGAPNRSAPVSVEFDVRTAAEEGLEEQALDDELRHLEWGYAMGRDGGAALLEAEVMLLDDTLDSGIRFQVLLGLAECEDSHARDVIKRAASEDLTEIGQEARKILD